MIDLDTTVEDTLARNPALASSFVSHRMICVGCAIARFHTLREAALMYNLEPEALLDELLAQLGGRQSASAAAQSSSNHPDAPREEGEFGSASS
jgi:hybrid cluster-associated redox disulfide protein